MTETCWCAVCRPITLEDMRMIVCPDCGNKRCPKASDHEYTCTGSNDSGQPGSLFGGVCTYPLCWCPFDAPADPDWCALGLPHERKPNAANNPEDSGAAVGRSG